MRRFRGITRTAITGIVAVMAGWLLLGLAFKYFVTPSETTDPDDYAATLKEWVATGVVGHFPPAIPASASAVRFSAFPGFLQGGGHVRLRLTLPADEVAALEAKFATMTTHGYDGGDIFEHYNRDQKNNWPTTSFYTDSPPKGSGAFPVNYKLYALSATDRSLGSWNHADTTGVAVSRERNEVVYWAEKW